MDIKGKINLGRQFELDAAKFLAILFMVLVHCFDYSTLGLEGTTSARGVIEFMGSTLAAPVFMFCMGVGMVYSKHSEPSQMAKRGLGLLVSGYLLNLYRSAIPLSMYAAGMQGWAETRPFFVKMLLCVDILPFAGLAFLFFAGAKALRLGTWKTVAAVIVLLLLSPLVPKVGEVGSPLRYIVGLFAYQDEFTSFPLMQWLPFPMAGILFGQCLIGASDKRRFYLLSLGAGAALFVCASAVAFLTGRDIGDFFTTTYLDMQPLQIVWTLGAVLLWISLIFFASVLLRCDESPVGKFAVFCSRQINRIYIWHWIVLVPVILLTFTLCPVDALWKLLLEFAAVFAVACLIVKRIALRDAAKKAKIASKGTV